MKLLNLFIAVCAMSIGLVMGGCATTGSTSDQARLPNYEIAKKLVASIVPKSEKGAGGVRCPAKVKKGEKVSRLVRQANSCITANSWQRVKMIGHFLAETNPESPLGAYYLSLVADRNHDLNQALWMNDLALKKAPQTGLFHYQKARLLFEKRHYPQAVTEFRKALNLDSRLYEAHGALGMLYLREGEIARATEQFKALSAADPHNEVAAIGLEKCGVKTETAGKKQNQQVNRSVASKEAAK